MSEPFLYQHLHLAHGQVRNLTAHLTLLDGASQHLFGRAYCPEEKALSARILALAAQEGYASSPYSAFVRLEITPSGEERLIYLGGSLYEGYALRSIHPTGATIPCNMPHPEAPTSAREATSLLATAEAQRNGADLALCYDREGVLLSAEEAPLFGIRGKSLYLGASYPNVERFLLLQLLPQTGLVCASEPLSIDILPEMEEIFFVDYRGITALRSCNQIPLMVLLVERLANAMERAFSNL